MDTKKEVLYKYILPLIASIEECSKILDKEQHQNSAWVIRNDYLQSLLASHTFEMIGKIYIWFSQLKKSNNKLDSNWLIKKIFERIKKPSHSINEIYTKKIRKDFGIYRIRNIRKIKWLFDDDISTKYYQIDFFSSIDRKGKKQYSSINICCFENARYWIFSGSNPEYFPSTLIDTSLKLSSMIYQLKSLCTEENLIKNI